MSMDIKQEFIKLNPDDRLHGCPVPVIGLTGGIGTGKSTVSNILEEKGYFIIDADLLVKKIYQKSSVQEFVQENWPEVINGEKIDFKQLGKVVFADQLEREKLEKEIYSHLKEAFLSELDGQSNIYSVIYDVPLLFEKNLSPLVDLRVVVYAPRAIQIERIQKRDRISKEEAELVLANQMDIEEKKEKADFVIDNSGDLDQLNLNIDQFLRSLHG